MIIFSYFRPVSRLATPLALLITLFALSACATRDDFGRTKSNFFTEKVLPFTRAAIHEMRGITTSDYELTYPETQMRVYADSLKENGRGSSVQDNISYYAEKAGFYESDSEMSRFDVHNSGVSAFEYRGIARRPGALMAAIREDYRVSVAFARASEKVYSDDWARLQFLASSPDVNSSTHINVIGRARENRRIVLQTLRMLVNRVDDYRLEARDSLLRYPGGDKAKLYLEIDRLAVLIDEIRINIRPLASPGRPPGSIIAPQRFPHGTTGPKPTTGDKFKTAKAIG